MTQNMLWIVDKTVTRYLLSAGARVISQPEPHIPHGTKAYNFRGKK